MTILFIGDPKLSTGKPHFLSINPKFTSGTPILSFETLSFFLHKPPIFYKKPRRDGDVGLR